MEIPVWLIFQDQVVGYEKFQWNGKDPNGYPNSGMKLRNARIHQAGIFARHWGLMTAKAGRKDEW